MTDKELVDQGNALSEMKNSRGWKYYSDHVNAEAKEALERFIELPAHKLTDFEAFQYKAEYRVRKNDLSWVDEKIKSGEQAEEFLKKEEQLESATTH